MEERSSGELYLLERGINQMAEALESSTRALELRVSDATASLLAQKQAAYPITKQIYSLATSAGSPETPCQAAALGVYGMGLLGGTLALASALLGRRLGAIFRA